MTFQITGLPRDRFRPLFHLDDLALRQHGAVRCRVESKPGYPCRVSLADAEPGEEILLLHYAHHDVASPFRSSYAIYVRPEAEEAALPPDALPAVFHGRILSLRGFDRAGMLKAADLTEGDRAGDLIATLFADPAIAYIHAHFAKPGCYAARIDRA